MVRKHKMTGLYIFLGYSLRNLIFFQAPWSLTFWITYEEIRRFSGIDTFWAGREMTLRLGIVRARVAWLVTWQHYQSMLWQVFYLDYKLCSMWLESFSALGSWSGDNASHGCKDICQKSVPKMRRYLPHCENMKSASCRIEDRHTASVWIAIVTAMIPVCWFMPGFTNWCKIHSVTKIPPRIYLVPWWNSKNWKQSGDKQSKYNKARRIRAKIQYRASLGPKMSCGDIDLLQV